MCSTVTPDALAAAHAAAEAAVADAWGYGRLPSLRSREFVTAPPEVRLAVLAICGLSYLLADDTLAAWVGEDYAGGAWWRQHVLLPAAGELRRRRYPPVGDRAAWVRNGPRAGSDRRPSIGAIA